MAEQGTPTTTTQWAVMYRWFQPDWKREGGSDVRLSTGKWREECDMLQADNATKALAVRRMMEHIRKINHPMYRGPISDARLVSRKRTVVVTLTEWAVVRTTSAQRMASTAGAPR